LMIAVSGRKGLLRKFLLKHHRRRYQILLPNPRTIKMQPPYQLQYQHKRQHQQRS